MLINGLAAMLKGLGQRLNLSVCGDEGLDVVFGGVDQGFLLISPEPGGYNFALFECAAGAVESRS